MSAAEFAEWLAYYSVEPFGEVTAELRAARICSVLYAVNNTDIPPSEFTNHPDIPKRKKLTGAALERALETMSNGKPS